MGYILLEGGAEFGGGMAEPDLRALNLAGGLDARLNVIPAAAAPDDNHQRAGNNARRWFNSLGARGVKVLALIDRKSADDPEIAGALQQSRMIYMLGGFPRYLARTLGGSVAWQAILQAYRAGAVIGGSSAGAMVLCDSLYDPMDDEIVEGLNLIPGVCILPHHDTFGAAWAPRLKRVRPDLLLVGLDEQTGILNDGEGGRWQVYGKGTATIYRAVKKSVFGPGEPFLFNDANAA